LTTRCLQVRVNFGIQTIVHIFLKRALPLGLNEADAFKSTSTLIYYNTKQIFLHTKGGLMPKVIKMGGIIHGIRIGEVGSNYDFGNDATLQRASIS
jgi:hypothetical protein